jgi:hypothetical protein
MHAISFHDRFAHLGHSPAHRRARFTRTRALWRDIGIGLGIAALGLTLIGFAVQAGSAVPSPDEVSAPPHAGFGVAPAVFAPDAITVP